MAVEETAQEQSTDGYSCHIHIKNTSEQDFYLAASGIKNDHGAWPPGQPPMTISAKTSTIVHIKDSKLTEGSDGWVTYEVMVCDRMQSFTLEFANPKSFRSQSFLRGRTSDSNIILLSLRGISNEGHDFTAVVDVRVIGNACTESGHQAHLSERSSEITGSAHLCQYIDTAAPYGQDDSTRDELDIGNDTKPFGRERRDTGETFELKPLARSYDPQLNNQQRSVKHKHPNKGDDLEYEAQFQQKLARLEAGTYTDCGHLARNQPFPGRYVVLTCLLTSVVVCGALRRF